MDSVSNARDTCMPETSNAIQCLPSVSLERYMKSHVDPRTHIISSFSIMPLRFSMAQVLMERSEKKRLIMTAKLLQERFDRYLADPCLPHLFAGLQSIVPPTGAGQDGNTEPAWKAVEPTTWNCAFNHLGAVEKRLRTQHGKISVQSMCLGVRLRNFL